MGLTQKWTTNGKNKTNINKTEIIQQLLNN